MVRKILYSLIVISLAFVVNQVRGTSLSANNNNLTTTLTNTAPPVSTAVMTGSLEVRITASNPATAVAAADITVSSVEVYTGDGWTKMTLADSNKVDLIKALTAEQTIARLSEFAAGNYTQIRLTISRVDVTQEGGQSIKAGVSASKLTFIQNFPVTARNTTVLVVDFDALRSISSSGSQVSFKPTANFFYTSPGALLMMPANIPQAEMGVPYTVNLRAFGGVQPYSWSISMGDLPPGLSLDPQTGVISGTPTASGVFGATVRVDDNSPNRKNTARNYFMGVADKGALQIITGILPDGRQDGDYRATLLAVGGAQPYTWGISANNLPAGLTLDVATGIVSGAASVSGDFTFVIKATDSSNPANTDTQVLNLHIGKQLLTN